MAQISLQVRSGEEVELRCESQGGNPAPILRWFIDDQELEGSLQKNESSIGNPRQWNSYSLIKAVFQKVTETTSAIEFVIF